MLSVIIPTLNERENLVSAVEQVFAALGKIPAEVVIVDDDSPDGTGEVAESLKSKFPVEVVHRKGKKGLASAVLAGAKVAHGDYLCLMDADLSHDASILPRLWDSLQNGNDLAIGSRRVKGGGTKNWPARRRFASWLSSMLARPITRVRDNTTGYFCMKRSVLEGLEMDAMGFKFGLEIFVKGRYNRFEEIPYVFEDRRAGKSKLDAKEIITYFTLLFRLYAWKITQLFSPQGRPQA